MKMHSLSLILATVISAALLCAAAADPTPTPAKQQTAAPAPVQHSAAQDLQNVHKDPKAFDTTIKNPEPVKASTGTVTAQQAIKDYTSKPPTGPQTLKTNPVPAPATTGNPFPKNPEKPLKNPLRDDTKKVSPTATPK